MTQNGQTTKPGARVRALVFTALAMTAAAPAVAQTVSLTVSKDATLRGGSYATTKYGSQALLETRASSDPIYVRRAALTFDTETTVPAGATIQSATLVLTVRGGNAETRQLGAFGMPISFDEPYVTWTSRKSGIAWSNPGGDTSGSGAYATVSGIVGSQVSFNVTPHVQAVVKGQYGSRYSRFLVVDGGGSSRESYREYHSRESTDTARRPKLVVTYGSGTSAPTSDNSTTATTATANSSGDLIFGPEHVSRTEGRWAVQSDSTAFNGRSVRHADAGLARITSAYASPTHYFEMTFQAQANTAYRLWVHGRADRDYWANDSVHVQFSGSVTSGGSAVYRIGTTSSAEVNIEECSGCGLSGWDWQDNGYGANVLGQKIYFATNGTHTIRVQTREDGLAIDRILLSPATYLSSPPGGSTTGTSGETTGGGSSTGGSTGSSSTTSTLKVLDWNIHHGVGSDGVYDIDRIAAWIAKTGANVVSLNEVEKYTGWGNEDQPARFASLLKSKTGKTWHYNFATRDGNTNGQGNLLLSTFAIDSTADHLLSYTRSVAQIRLTINGRTVNIFSTHLDAESSARRTTQIGELKSWTSTFPEQRIIAGDFNAYPGSGEIAGVTSGHHDTWAVAKVNGTAVAYSGNEAGNTKNSRIDYVFQSKGAASLVVKASQVFDTRNSSGVMPSDHRPVMTTFEVR